MPTPGEHRTIRGVEVVAVDFRNFDCSDCRFTFSKNENRPCAGIDCTDVAWITPIEYIAHRLTEELP